MNFFQKIANIKEMLQNSGHHDVAKMILETQLSGGTGGEVLIMVCSKLLGVKERQEDIYMIIRNEANELISYARSIGLEPVAT